MGMGLRPALFSRKTHQSFYWNSRNLTPSVSILSTPFACAFCLFKHVKHKQTNILAQKNATQGVNFLVCPALFAHPRHQGRWLLWLLLWHINKSVKVESTWQPLPFPFPLPRCLLLRPTLFNFISFSDSAIFYFHQTIAGLEFTVYVELNFSI